MSWSKVLIKTLILGALGSILIKISEQGQIKGEADVIKANLIAINQQTIKLYGIDTPELAQLCYVKGLPWQCGLTAKRKLAEKIKGESLTCLIREQESNNLPLAECFLGRENINAWLVDNGWAIADRQNSRSFISHEILAKRNKQGIYQSKFLKPSLWREINPTELTLNREESILNH